MKKGRLDLTKLGRIMVFIDAANIIYSCKSLGWHIKYERLMNYFKNGADLRGIYFYYAKREASDRDQKLLPMLEHFGFTIRVRRIKIFKNPDGTIQVKGNIDGELIVEMIKLQNEYDTAFLLSGDSDFSYAVSYLKGLSKKVFIISTRHHVSHELITASSGYINLRDFKSDWSFI